MKNTFKNIVLAVCFTIAITQVKAQMNPHLAQYYINRYLGNPAMAGFTDGLNLNLSFQSQWNNMPGAPITQNISADYGRGKLGLGLNLHLDKTGLQRQSRVVGTYAYHLPLNENNSALHFGLSFGFMNQRIAEEEINGERNDALVGAYNQRQTYMDGDFGVAYTSDKWTAEAALPNLKNILKRDVIKLVDMPTFYTALSYKIPLNDCEFEPKLAYRGFKGFDNIWDVGTQFSFIQKQILLVAMYHSSGSASFGLGMDYKKRYTINLVHNVQTSVLNSYTNGTFEINLRGRF